MGVIKRKDTQTKTIVWTKYGPPDVLQLKEVAKPTPKDNEILVKVHATTVTAGDCVMRGATFPPLYWLPMRIMNGLKRSRIIIRGSELAGEIEAVGKSSFSRCKGSLKKKGFYLATVPTMPVILQMLWTSKIGNNKVISGIPSPSKMPEDLIFPKELIEAGKIKSAIDRRYPLEQNAEAHSYVETGGKKGNVVITVEHNNKT